MSPTSPSSSLADVRALRLAIAHADEQILQALADRFRAVRTLKQLKKSLGMPIVQPARERALALRWKRLARKTGLPSPIALRMLDALLEQSRRFQGHDA